MAEWCEEAIEALSALTAGAARTNVVPIEDGPRGKSRKQRLDQTPATVHGVVFDIVSPDAPEGFRLPR